MGLIKKLRNHKGKILSSIAIMGLFYIGYHDTKLYGEIKKLNHEIEAGNNMFDGGTPSMITNFYKEQRNLETKKQKLIDDLYVLSYHQ